VRIVLLVARRVVADPQLDRIDRERVGGSSIAVSSANVPVDSPGRALKRRGRDVDRRNAGRRSQASTVAREPIGTAMGFYFG
jgi:hypothetical protein